MESWETQVIRDVCLIITPQWYLLKSQLRANIIMLNTTF
ncbi:hypothetical protein GPUN_1399 [Glaciecola punicea ACAM 611]|uniref:Uncharacterized protein n=1 Tax=Glaciecola punicea ACAM 611 TaxID=1121923 RepID=H5TB46_9ALTE|nr:hypothetical protein GPUN_1399 [Glaciecola punicea ACAM 611]